MGNGRRTWLLLVLTVVTACGAVMAAPRVADGSGTPERTAADGSGTPERTAAAGSEPQSGRQPPAPNPGADLGAGRRLPADLR